MYFLTKFCAIRVQKSNAYFIYKVVKLRDYFEKTKISITPELPCIWQLFDGKLRKLTSSVVIAKQTHFERI